MRGRRAIRIETFVAALLILSAAGPPLSAQEREDAGSSAWTAPEGPVLLELGESYTHALSALPVQYLRRLTSRTLDRGHSLSMARRHVARLGVRVADRWIVGAERAWIDTKLGLANVEVPMRQVGGVVHYLFPGSFYALAGAGTVTYAPDGLASNTDVRWMVGAGGWFRLNDHLAVKSVVRDDMSWFSVPGADGGLQHQLTIGGTMILSIP